MRRAEPGLLPDQSRRDHSGTNPAQMRSRSSSTEIDNMNRASTSIKGGLPSGMSRPPAVAKPGSELLAGSIFVGVEPAVETRVCGLTS